MTLEPEETILVGGNVNNVVKVGKTVRRKTGPFSPNIHALLLHLETKKVDASRFLGIDDKGREILAFIEGETDFPTDLWDNPKYVVSTANLLRRLHDSSTDFTPPNPGNWAYSDSNPNRCDVIGHNDFAPYNMVFKPDGAVSIIDFDLCGPAPRSRDLAYLAYWMTPLSFGSTDLVKSSQTDLENGCARLKLLCQTYGFGDFEDLLQMVSEVLHHMSSEEAASRMIGEDAADRLKLGGHFEHWGQEAAAFDQTMPLLRKFLV